MSKEITITYKGKPYSYMVYGDDFFPAITANLLIHYTTGRKDVKDHFFNPWSLSENDTKEGACPDPETAVVVEKKEQPRYFFCGYTDIVQHDGEEMLLVGAFYVRNYNLMDGFKKIHNISEILVRKDKSILIRDEFFYRAGNREKEKNDSNWYADFVTGNFVPFDWDKYKHIVVPHITGHLKQKIVWLGKDLQETATKFFQTPVAFLAGNKTFTWNETEYFVKWLKYVPPAKKVTKAQAKVNNLLALELPVHEMTELQKKGNIAFVDNISNGNENIAVIRTFTDAVEAGRIYVGKKDVMVMKFNGQEYIPYGQWRASSKNWRFALQEHSADVFKDTQLEYYQTIVGELPREQASLAMWLFLAFPICEQIGKYNQDGFEAIKKMMHLLWNSGSTTNVRVALKEFWGKINDAKKKLHQKLGLSPAQMEYFIPIWSDSLNTDFYFLGESPRRIKELILMDDISSIDETTFEMLVKISRKAWTTNSSFAYSLYRKRFEAFSITRDIWGFKTAMKAWDTILFLSRIDNFFDRNDYRRTLPHFCDLCRMAQQLEMVSRIKPYFESFEEFHAAHDMLSDVMNAHQSEYEKKQWNIQKSKWEKWEYKNSDKNEFVVIAPDKPEDLADEGIHLHHCVKSYIGRVANGETNIMFIRKKEDINTPFFTVEVGNTGVIEQVHGFGNRNMDTELNLEAFVKEWAKKCNLKLNRVNKVR